MQGTFLKFVVNRILFLRLKVYSMKTRLFILSFLLAASCWAATNPDPQKKVTTAAFTELAPNIDGVLDEPAWLLASPSGDFIQNRPNPGTQPSQRTEVKILYDNQGIYIGATIYDDQPDRILRELSERDNLGNTDWFGVVIDAYRDGINGFGFIVTASNVQLDTKYSSQGEDDNWDAVWESNVNINEEGWVVEMRIPYAALRFPSLDEQLWHLNFVRQVARTKEKSFWSEVNPQLAGFLNQSGYLKGIQNIKSPTRLQATPFIAAYGQQHHDGNTSPRNTYGHSINGGMDVKWGLSDAFTLDLTLIPDFGEAQSDNQVLNLSPFEVQFNENRPFFTEGTELFSKGNLFYSRRVGGQPLYYDAIYEQYTEDQLVSNPGVTQLYNATKISGRTAKGTGIGFFNATAGRTYATVRDPEQGERSVLTNPLTNYSVFVLDQNLAHNSYATLINTTVMREGGAYDANVTGTDFLLRNKANSYAVGGRAAISQKYQPGQTDLGHTVALRLRKTSGNVEAGLNYLEESDTYDPNDLGFLYNNNERSVSGFVEYNRYESFGRFNRGGLGLYTEYNRLFNPNVFTNWGANVWAWAESKSFWNYNIWTYVSPGNNYDYFESRQAGRLWKTPGSASSGLSLSTDSRKRLRLEFDGNYWSAFAREWYNVSASMEARYRFSDRLNANVSVEQGFSKNDIGYVNEATVTTTDPETQVATSRLDIFFGQRDRKTIETALRTNYTFHANMVLSFRMRHYWSAVTYNAFHQLGETGDLLPTSYTGSHDGDFDAFNIDLIYRWRFAPGSDIFIIWKNSLYSSSDEVAPTYLENLQGLFREPQDNSISVKVIYFLDYAALKGR
ncbi:MAG: hypothetical protein DA408_01420 [Bacteroidetes bacterium]|nr:MAG: hypothetical protein C7N36_01465 [Bacteroidota bacterium]PTM14978.1 MAG: hypothetical protein DA408_01420 [Bacteroidota bacterium]